MKNLIATITLFSCLFLGCKKITNEFNIDSINLNDYPVISDSLVLRSLVYDNPIASGKDKYLDWTRKRKGNYESESEYEEALRFQMQNFDDFFWETIDRDSLKREPNKYYTQRRLYIIRDSVTYRIIDTLSLNKHYGILIYSNNEYIVLKELFLVLYNSQDKLVGTYLVAKKYEYEHSYHNVKGRDVTTRDTKEIRSTLSTRNRLDIYTTEEDANYNLGKTMKYYSSKVNIHSVYNLNKQTMIKSDTVKEPLPIYRKNTGVPPLLDW